MSPQTASRRYTHTHLKWFMGTSVFSTFPLQDFSFFYFLFSFLPMHKKHKNANKQIYTIFTIYTSELTSYFFPLRCFLSRFLIFVCLFAFCAFALLRFCFLVFFGAFQCFLVLLVRTKEIKSLTQLEPPPPLLKGAGEGAGPSEN